MDAPGRPTLITATAVLSAKPAALTAIAVTAASAGQTIKIHDCTTTGAAAAGNEKFRLTTDAVQSVPMDEGAYFELGIVAVVSGGTPVATAVIS